MKQQTLRDCWAKEKGAINAWCSIPSAVTAEMMSLNDFDSITIDMQHGLVDYQAALNMLQVISGSGKTPMVRVPWNEPGIIMRMLDLGVMGVIAPMINSKEDCERFVSYCYYPKIGQRSFGPMRAQLIHGQDYYNQANKNILSFAMIETKEAVENLDKILSVPNLTGIYIGPADMSSSYGLPPKFDVREDPVFSNIKLISEKAKKFGKISGIHNGSTDYAKEMISIGYDLVTILSDFRVMSLHSQKIVDTMREKVSKNSDSSTY